MPAPNAGVPPIAATLHQQGQLATAQHQPTIQQADSQPFRVAMRVTATSHLAILSCVQPEVWCDKLLSACPTRLTGSD